MNASENVYLRTNYTINPNSKEEINEPVIDYEKCSIDRRIDSRRRTGNLNKCAKQEDRCPLASGDNEIWICAQAR